ncbi:MAG: hypothetical protein KDK78_00625, partial [Chlamydiia bacterium]|nr:hypothetical protein [Chlamydiia bacterium]
DILNGKDSASDEAYLRAYYLVLGSVECNEIHRLHFATQQHRDELVEQLILSLSDPSLQKRFQALQWIAEEMKRGLGETGWTAMQSRPYKEIQTSIQGSLDKAQIKRVLQWHNHGCSDEEMLRTQAWMDTWLNQTEDYSSLMRAVSGSNALKPGCPIRIELYRRGPDYIPIAHTCSDTLELSGQYPDYETFKEKLLYLLAQARAGFDFA